MASVFYSVGQNTSDHKTGSPTLTMSGGVATFSVAQTATNMGVGDRVTYDTSKIAYISGKTSTTVWTLVTAVGATPSDEGSAVTVNSIAHEYASLSAAEAGAADSNHLNTQDLVTNTYTLYIPCYYDTGADTTAVTFDSGWSTNATYRIIVYTPIDTSSECNQSQRHDGKWKATAYNLTHTGASVSSFYIYPAFMRVEGLQIHNSSTSFSYGFRVAAITGTLELEANILRGGSGVGYKAYDLDAVAAGSTTKIWNNLCYDWYYYGIFVDYGNAATWVVYNNGFADGNGATSYYYIRLTSSGGTLFMKNNWCQGSNAQYSVSVGTQTTSNNISEDTTSPDASYREKVITFESEGTDDFHLASGDTEAKDNGVDLSGDGQLAFSDDIDGDSRSGDWDIGPDEYSAAGPPSPPTLTTPADEATVYDSTPTLAWTGSADYWHIQVDTDASFGSPTAEVTDVTNSAWVVSPALDDDYWHWRGRGYGNGDWGDWATAFQFTMDADPTLVTLLSPADDSTLYDSTPALSATMTGWGGTVDYFHVQVDVDASFGSPQAQSTDVTVWPWTVTPALDETAHNWRVRAHGSDGDWGGWCAAWQFTVDADPTLVTLLSPADESTVYDATPDLSATMTGWGGTVDYFHLQVDADAGFGSPEAESTDVTQFPWTVSPALDETLYNWRARAHGQDGDWGDWCTAWQFTVDADPPAPTLLSPTDEDTLDDATPDLSWTLGDWGGTADYYHVQVDTDASFGSPTAEATDVTTIPWTTTPELSEDYWHWRVRGHGADGGWGAWATPWQFTVAITAPAPTLLSPADDSTVYDFTPDLSWTPASWGGTIDYYHVQVDVDVGFGGPAAETTDVTELSWTVSPSLDDTLYNWRVRMHDESAGWGSWADAWQFTVDAVPPATTLISPDDAGTVYDNTPDLGYTMTGWGGTVDYFHVQVDDDVGFGSVTAEATDVTVGTWTVTSTLTETTYYWRARAHGSDGDWGDWPTARSFVVDACPPAPTLLSPADDSRVEDATPDLSATIGTWGGTVDFFHVQLDDSVDFGSPTAEATDVTAWPWTVTPSQGDDDYYWRVRAHGSSGDWGDWCPAWNLEIDAVNDPPTADAQAVGTVENTPVAITLTGSDPNEDALTYETVDDPIHGDLTGTPPNVTYTPDTGYSGEDTFTFRVYDGEYYSDPATVTVTITPTPDVVSRGGLVDFTPRRQWYEFEWIGRDDMLRFLLFTPLLFLNGCITPGMIKDIQDAVGPEVTEHGGEIVGHVGQIVAQPGNPIPIIGAVGAVVALVTGALTRYLTRKQLKK